MFEQYMCSTYEAVDDLSVNCKQCGKVTKVFWGEDFVGKFIDYLSGPDHLQTRFTSYHVTLLDKTQVSAAKYSGTEMDVPIDNERYQNS